MYYLWKFLCLQRKDLTPKKTRQIAQMIQPQTASRAGSSELSRTTSKQLVTIVQPHRPLHPGLQLSSVFRHHTECGQPVLQLAFLGRDHSLHCLRAPERYHRSHTAGSNFKNTTPSFPRVGVIGIWLLGGWWIFVIVRVWLVTCVKHGTMKRILNSRISFSLFLSSVFLSLLSNVRGESWERD